MFQAFSLFGQNEKKINPLQSALKAGASELPCNASDTDQAIITSNVHMQ